MRTGPPPPERRDPDESYCPLCGAYQPFQMNGEWRVKDCDCPRPQDG